MRHRSTTRGFTIIETLIFLAVASFVFTAAVGQYTNQQHQVAFNQGVRGLQSNIITLISEVSSSFSPSMSGYTCNAAASNSQITFTAPAGDTSGCVFLGKAMAFGGAAFCDENTIDGCSHYITFPIAGRRLNYIPPADPLPVASLAEAKPFALLSCATDAGVYTTNFPCGPIAGPGAHPNFSTPGRFDQGVNIYKAFVRNATGGVTREIGGFAFIFNLSSAAYGSPSNNSTVDLAYLNTNFQGNNRVKSLTAVEALAATNLNPPNGITLCLLDGYGKRSAISIGANGSNLDVIVEPISNLDSGCTS